MLIQKKLAWSPQHNAPSAFFVQAEKLWGKENWVFKILDASFTHQTKKKL